MPVVRNFNAAPAVAPAPATVKLPLPSKVRVPWKLTATSLLPEAFKVRLFKAFLDAAVSEQIARRVAMKGATENAGEMIKDLSRQYNRARQANITKEISEVIGGAAALD